MPPFLNAHLNGNVCVIVLHKAVEMWKTISVKVQ